jgi:7-carboxy-7-deazaguanine synthase
MSAIAQSIKVHTMNVSEVYGPVCQGEGLLIGKPTVFVRFGGCDYRCAWCDSLYAVLPEHRDEWTPMTAREIADQVSACLPEGHTFGHVTLSGGNPAIQPWGGHLVDLLHDRGYRVAIETQGSVAPKWVTSVDELTLSPKPPSSGNPTPYGVGTKLHLLIDRHSRAGKDVCLKVVVFDDEDYAYAKAVHLAHPEVEMFFQAGTLVGEATRDDLCDALNALQERVLADPELQNVAVLPQLHAILRGHDRGI